MPIFGQPKRAFFVMLALLGLAATPSAAEIPAEITTPDRVETRIGTLEFVDGFPTAETVELVYNNLDFLRGMEAFLNVMPAASLHAMRQG